MTYMFQCLLNLFPNISPHLPKILPLIKFSISEVERLRENDYVV